MKVCLFVLCAALACAVAGCNRGGPVAEAVSPGTVVTTYEDALAKASAQRSPILVVAYQGSSQDVDQMILSDPSITSHASKVVTAKLDANTQSQAMTKLGIQDYPMLAVLSSSGAVLWRKKSATPPEVGRALESALGVSGSGTGTAGAPGGPPGGP
jgi:hypothetical protein